MVRVPICSDEVLERVFLDPDVVAQAWSSAGALADEAVSIELRASDAPSALVALVRLLGARGLLGLTVPAELGGTYERVRSDALCLARERLGYASPLVERMHQRDPSNQRALVVRPTNLEDVYLRLTGTSLEAA